MYTYKAVFDWKINNPLNVDFDKEVLEITLIAIHNEVSDIANPLLPEWNSEWDKEHFGDYGKEYNEYMRKKHQEIVDTIVKKRTDYGSVFYAEFDKDIQLHVGYSMFGFFDCDVTFHLEEV